MVEDLYSKVDYTKKIGFQTNEEDKNTNTRGNTDNATIYDNYCTEECTQPKLKENTSEDQQQAVPVNEGSRKKNLLRGAAVFLGLLCLLLLTAVIALLVLWILDKSNWNTKRNQLQEENAKLVSERDNLQTSYDEMKILNANLTQNTSRLENEKDILNAVKLNLTKEIDKLKKQIEPPCPANWTKFGKSCYYLLFTLEKNWMESETICQKSVTGAHLVIISSIEEQMFASRLKGPFWIGLTDQEKEGEWKWVNGQNVTNKYWRNSQPDNWGSSEDCAELSIIGEPNSNWNDLPCNLQRNFICEIEN